MQNGRWPRPLRYGIAYTLPAIVVGLIRVVCSGWSCPEWAGSLGDIVTNGLPYLFIVAIILPTFPIFAVLEPLETSLGASLFILQSIINVGVWFLIGFLLGKMIKKPVIAIFIWFGMMVLGSGVVIFSGWGS